MSHESHPEQPIYVPTGGEGQFANTIENQNHLAFLNAARKQPGSNEVAPPLHIEVHGDDLGPQEIPVEHIGHSPNHLADRRVDSNRKRTRNGAILGAVAAVAILGGLHVASKRLDNQQKAQMEQTQPVRDAVQANILANEQRATNDAIPPLDPNQIP